LQQGQPGDIAWLSTANTARVFELGELKD